MLLNELLDRAIPYKVVVSSADKFVTAADIGGREIAVRCSKTVYQYNTLWFVEFAQVDGNKTTFKATGSGNELQVFSVVVSSIKELVSRYEPDMIRFTASKSEGEIGDTRASLYARLAQRFKMPDYDLIRKEQGEDFVFEFVHVNAEANAEQRRKEEETNKQNQMSPEDQARYEMFKKRREQSQQR